MNRALMFTVVTTATILLPSLVVAQTATLRGTVTDPSGAILAGAAVTVKNTDKGWTRSTKSNDSGDYVVTQLSPDPYSITVESSGFKTGEIKGVILQVGQEARVDVVLQIGSTQERIVVVSDSPLVQSENSSSGAVVDNRKIVDLPLNGREFWQLARIAPMVMDPPQNSTLGFRGGFNVAGSSEVTNAFVMDGIDNNDETTGQPTHRPSVDGIREFKVLTGIYPAEYGRQAGGQIIITTMSGANDFHGTAFYFHRNDNLDARNFFLVGPKPELKRHQYGFSNGGRILRDRTFYFATYEALTLGESVARLQTVPTLRVKSGDLAEINRVIRDPANGQPFAGNRIPDARIHRVSRGFLEYWPTPNLAGLANNYSFNGVRTQDQDQFSSRVDHKFSNQDNLYFSYQFSQRRNSEPSNALCGDRGLPIFSCTEPERTQHGALVHTHIFNPGLINEARVGFNRIRTNRFQDDMTLGNIVQKLGLPQGGMLGLASPDNFNTGVPSLRVTGWATIGGPTNLPQGRRVTNYHFVDGLTWIRGGHTFKGGFDVKRYLFNSFFTSFGRGDFFFNGQFSGDPFADFLLGGLRSTDRQPGEPFNNIYTTTSNFYFQDDWNVTRNLTLNLGLRYELSTPVRERVDKNASWDVATGNIITSDGQAINVDRAGNLVTVGRSSLGRDMWRMDKNNFAPRIGFAWRAFGDNRTVFRGGYGLFYNHLVSANGISAMYRGLPFRRRESFINTPANVVATWDVPFPPGISGGGLAPEGMNATFPDAYIQQYSFGIQRELKRDMVLETTYLGSKGTRLPLNFNINQPTPAAGAIQGRRPFQPWGAINYRDPVGTSNFHALSVRIERRFTAGLSLLSSWTYSKSIDLGNQPATSGDGDAPIQDMRNLRAERGLSEFDTRHRFINSIVYELPFGKGRKWLSEAGGVPNHIIGGWQVTGILLFQSGRPYTIVTSRDMSNTGAGATGTRPNLVGDPRIANPTPTQWFNQAAFSDVLPAGVFAFGNLGSNTMIADGVVNLDLAAFKNIPLHERAKLQFRAELFNSTNHANFAIPNRQRQGGAFGTVSGTTNLNRQIQFGMKVVF